MLYRYTGCIFGSSPPSLPFPTRFKSTKNREFRPADLPVLPYPCIYCGCVCSVDFFFYFDTKSLMSFYLVLFLFYLTHTHTYIYIYTYIILKCFQAKRNKMKYKLASHVMKKNLKYLSLLLIFFFFFLHLPLLTYITIHFSFPIFL